jgi:hypothetical protein
VTIVSAVVIGAVLLSLTLWLLLDFSLRPIMGNTCGDEIDVSPLADNDDDAGGWRSRVKNGGFGPAIVTRVRYQMAVPGDTQIMEFDTCAGLLDALHARVGAVDDRDFELLNFTPGSHIAGREERTVSTVAMPTARKLARFSVVLTCRSLISPRRITKVIHFVPSLMPVDPKRRALPPPRSRTTSA